MVLSGPDGSPRSPEGLQVKRREAAGAGRFRGLLGPYAKWLISADLELGPTYEQPSWDICGCGVDGA